MPLRVDVAMPTLPLSVLDLATVEADGDVRAALRHSVELARAAEQYGYSRVWYAEHHNMSAIASSATSVLIAHVAAHTERIMLGAGGIMLPNHSPLVIAEQFGTLAELHPGRIELGLGRAPGSDQATFQAMRGTFAAAENFPSDIIELQRYLGTDLPRSAVNAYPGRGTNVPVFILGSSMFGASLAAQLGLPYAFASHFAPDLLRQAIAHYRSSYRPSETHPEPYAMAGVNVLAAETTAEAEDRFARVETERVRRFLSRGREQELTIGEAEALFDSPAGTHVREMLRFTAIGDAPKVAAELSAFAEYAGADELITVHQAMNRQEQLESLRLTAPA